MNTQALKHKVGDPWRMKQRYQTCILQKWISQPNDFSPTRQRDLHRIHSTATQYKGFSLYHTGPYTFSHLLLLSWMYSVLVFLSKLNFTQVETKLRRRAPHPVLYSLGYSLVIINPWYQHMQRELSNRLSNRGKKNIFNILTQPSLVYHKLLINKCFIYIFF